MKNDNIEDSDDDHLQKRTDGSNVEDIPSNGPCSYCTKKSGSKDILCISIG